MLWSWPKLPMSRRQGFPARGKSYIALGDTCFYIFLPLQDERELVLKICVFSDVYSKLPLEMMLEMIWIWLSLAILLPLGWNRQVGKRMVKCTDIYAKPQGLDMETYRVDSYPIDDLGYRWIQQSMLDEIWLVYNIYYTHINSWIWCVLLNLSKWFAFKSMFFLFKLEVITPRSRVITYNPSHPCMDQPFISI